MSPTLQAAPRDLGVNLVQKVEIFHHVLVTLSRQYDGQTQKHARTEGERLQCETLRETRNQTSRLVSFETTHNRH